MDFEFTKEIFVHSFVNPPSEDSSCNIFLDLVNSNGEMGLSREGHGSQTRYVLDVFNPLQIGFTSSEQNILSSEIGNLILALNLVLARTCITDSMTEYSPPKVKLRPPATKTSTTKQGTQTTISIEETVGVRDEVHVTMGTSEDIDVQAVIGQFKKIQRLNRVNITPSSPLTLLNLDKALDEFEKGMSPFDRVFKFKHVYNSVEFATNWDGRDRKDSVFDTEVAALTQVQQTDVETWRRFYNRTKHSDRNTADAQEYSTGVSNLSNTLPQIRECATKLLNLRLS